MTGKQLKNSILQWAIQGKLVPQDPNYEPASVLLERIREEKERLIKEKKIKRDKNASIIYRGDDNSHYEKFLATGEVKCIDEEIPFEIPCEWKWCRLRDIVCGTNAGKSPNCEKRPKQDREWGVLTTTAIQENEFRPDENKVLPQGYVINPEHCIKYGDILITRAGPVNRTGVACLVDKACDKLILSDKTIRIDYLRNYCNPAFLVLVLNCPDIHNLIMCMTVGMAASQVNVSQSNIQNTLIPFPPLAEQHHIVERVEMLLPIINKFNKTQISLDKLNSLMNDFLKKSILQEAIQGKLVEQCPDEEPASELLNRIKAEKERLIKEKIIKRDKQESIIYKGNDNSYFEKLMDGSEICIDEEVPFDLPESWNWVRLGCLAQLTIGKTPPRGEVQYWTNGCYNWVSISDMTDYGFISKTKEKVSEIAAKSAFGKISPKGALLMSFKLTVGRTSILNIDAYHNEAIITINPFIDDEFALRDYLFWVLPLISIYGDSKDAIKGKTLNSKSLYNLLIPLPLEKPRDFDPFGHAGVPPLATI